MLRSSWQVAGLCVALCAPATRVSAQAVETNADVATPTPATEPAPAPAPAAEPAPAPAAALPTQAPAPSVEAPAAAPPANAGAASCVIGESLGVPEPDAMTAAGLVCEALRQAGANIDATPTPAGDAHGSSAYRVSLHPLGKLLLLKVSFETPIGTTTDSRTLQLGKIEEVPVAATRIAESLVRGTKLADTAKVDTLVGQETRTYEKKQGEFSIGVGVFGFGAFNSDVVAGYGLFGKMYYEVLRYGVGGELRIGGSDNSSGDATLTSVALTGRYFFADGDITPFVGGGLGVMWFSDRSDADASGIPDNEYYYYDDFATHEGSGLAAHADVGLELLRMHDVRFDVLLRVDAPLFTIESFDDRRDDRYVVPVSLMTSFSFQ
jgi:hypothetical protein